MTITQGNALDVLKTIEGESIDCIITSPPYYQLRYYAGIPDYIWGGDENCEHNFVLENSKLMHENRNNTNGTQEEVLENALGTTFINRESKLLQGFCSICSAWKGQLGLEPTYQMYLDHLLMIMQECKRVLKPSGTMWINLGDSYSSVHSGGNYNGAINETGHNDFKQIKISDLPSKCLMLIPHRFAIRMVDELGLILRNDIIWAKPNGMPESVTDRFSKKHEFIFLFVKSQKYYFDLDRIREKPITKTTIRNKGVGGHGEYLGLSDNPRPTNNELGKNPGDVSDFWDIPTQPSSEKHYASYNFNLIDKPIIAGCPEGGLILDPFCGTGTTLVRAIQLNRFCVGIEGSEEYFKIANKRLQAELNLLKLPFEA